MGSIWKPDTFFNDQKCIVGTLLREKEGASCNCFNHTRKTDINKHYSG